MLRKNIHFLVEGDRCAAWLYSPDESPPYPVIVMAHGFAGTRHIRLDAYAERFADAGFAVLVFDYRHFGDSDGNPRQILDINKQLADWREAVRTVRAMPEIDSARIALWGTSFSGGHVLMIATEDEDIAACISQVPFIDGMANARNVSLKLSLQFGVNALRDLARKWLNRKPLTVAAIGLPGSFAAITTPDAEVFQRLMIPPGIEWVNEVAARIFLSIPRYRPGLHAGRVKCPLLFCLADNDAVTPIGPALKAASMAPQAEVRRYPLSHFDIYVGEAFERAIADQIAFLKRHLINK